MPVHCLTDLQKQFIARCYQDKTLNQKQLAENYQVSERTINRVLIEFGLATPIARIKGEAYQVMQLLKKHNLDKDSLEQLLNHLYPQVAQDNTHAVQTA